MWALLLQLILINISAALYAHKLTHLNTPTADTWTTPVADNIIAKTWRLFTGPTLYKQVFTDTPRFSYSDVRLKTTGDLVIDCWYSKPDSTAHGTVIMVHGLMGSKNKLIQEGRAFLDMGYNILMIDLRAHGKSEGSSISLGYREAEEVKLAYEHIKNGGEKNIFLYGTSLGAVVIIKAVSDHKLEPAGIIIEMPFLSLQTHLEGRARMFGFPEQPFAFLTTFWIGIEKGFNGFKHNVARYAKDIHCPVLMQYGAKDELVLKKETDAIFTAIASAKKKIVIYDDAKHQLFLLKDPATWLRETELFLKEFKKITS